jgi:hypothetical protein
MPSVTQSTIQALSSMLAFRQAQSYSKCWSTSPVQLSIANLVAVIPTSVSSLAHQLLEFHIAILERPPNQGIFSFSSILRWCLLTLGVKQSFSRYAIKIAIHKFQPVVHQLTLVG